MSLVLDSFLPTWEVKSEHEIFIRASPELVYESVRTLDLGESWGTRLLFRLRGLPRDALTLEGLERLRFAKLADLPPREMVLGLIGRFWTLSGKLRRTDADDFRRFSESGYAKAVWGFAVHERAEGGVILSTETRVLCLDDASRRSFRRYWRLVGPFSGWIRRQALRRVKARAEELTVRR